MSHNSFTHSQKDGKFYCQSHNFPEIIGQGNNETQALNDMINKIDVIKNVDLEGFVKRVKERTKKGLECECGVRLTDKAIGIMGV